MFIPYFTGSRSQVTEILQVSDNKQASLQTACQMQPAKFLPNVQCSLLNLKGAF